MRCYPGSYRLSFLLPAGAQIVSGRHRPSLDGCELNVTFPLVEILGRSRDAVFEHASRFLRVACRKCPAVSIAAILETPRPHGWAGRRSDTWSIIVGADIAFSPTSLNPYFPRPPPERSARGQARA